VLRIKFRQSEATVILRKRRSAAKFRPSRHAIASRVSGSVTPLNTTADAPRKVPSLLQATTAIAPIAEFFDTAASTFTLSKPIGGAIHFGPGADLAGFDTGTGASCPSSLMKRSTKMKTENPSNLIPGRSISHYQSDISYVKNQCLIDSMPSASNNRLNLVRGQTIEKRWGSPADDEHRHGEVATERSLSSLCCPSAERVRRQPVHRAPQWRIPASACPPA
jgi:hypothetical protein